MPHAAPDERFNPLAGALAWVLPGLGHFYLGEARRALCVGAGVLGLFFGGALIGGIDVVDRVEDKWWFVGQAGVGPVAFGVDWIHQNRFKQRDADGLPRTLDPSENPAISRSLGHPNEIGSLFGAIAGMLNVMCVLDALWRPRANRSPAPGRGATLGAGPAASAVAPADAGAPPTPPLESAGTPHGAGA